MKKIRLLCFIFFLFVFCICLSGCSNNNSKDKEKAVSEIKYLDSKILSLVNSMNNIKYEEYKVTTTKIEEKDKENSTSSSSNESNSSSNENSSKSEESDNKYTLQRMSILTNSDDEINWKDNKNEVEKMYSTLPTITLDLYNLNVNKDNILKFNNELDKLTVSVKEENKEKTLDYLSNMYEYLPKYLDEIDEKTVYTSILKTKVNIVNAYSILDSGDWNKISEYIDSAIEEYTNILNNIENNKKTYDVNKGYIMLNELKTATKLHDKDVFLIKYKNLLEEFNLL